MRRLSILVRSGWQPSGLPADPRPTRSWLGLVPVGPLARVAGVMAARRRHRLLLRELPFGARLLAAVLRSGKPTVPSMARVAAALGGPVGEWWGTVARALRRGVPPERAWRTPGDTGQGPFFHRWFGAPACDDEATSFARDAIRAADSGAALAETLSQLAARLTQRAGHEADASAARMSVQLIAPLICCFLPAFVLIGIVPVLIDLIAQATI